MKQYPYPGKAKIREVYEGIEDAGIRKRWGQNFLVDPNHVRKIASLFFMDGIPEPEIFEIGPGLGAITWQLLDSSCRLSAIELDPFLCSLLNRDLKDRSNFHLYEGDIRSVLTYIIKGSPVSAELEDAAKSFLACDIVGGNLPYYISSEIITGLARAGRWKRAVFLLQTEFAQRAAAKKTESSLTVYLANFAEWRISHHVPSSVFYPVPGVGSSVLVADRLPDGPQVNPELLEKILRISFRGKRKKILNAWKMGAPGDLDLDLLEKSAIAAGFDVSRRPDEMEQKNYFDLVKQIEESLSVL